VRIFGGGGGVILPEEIPALQAYGVARIYSPDDGRAVGLQGMIDDMLGRCDFATGARRGTAARLRPCRHPGTRQGDHAGRVVFRNGTATTLQGAWSPAGPRCPPVLGVTGTGGAGKSSLIDELLRRFLLDFPTVAHRGAGASTRPARRPAARLLGDRIRMNSAPATRACSCARWRPGAANLALSESVRDALYALEARRLRPDRAGDRAASAKPTPRSSNTPTCRCYVMTPEFGAASQLEKIDMLDYARPRRRSTSSIAAAPATPCATCRSSTSATRRRSTRDRAEMPVFGTMAATFADPGTNRFYRAVATGPRRRAARAASPARWRCVEGEPESAHVIPGRAASLPRRDRRATTAATTAGRDEQSRPGRTLPTRCARRAEGAAVATASAHTGAARTETRRPAWRRLAEKLRAGPRRLARLAAELHRRALRAPGARQATSRSRTTRSRWPACRSRRSRCRSTVRRRATALRLAAAGKCAGRFPFAAGVYPFKRTGEDPTRMFAGEGGPERTNQPLPLPVVRRSRTSGCRPRSTA
jgi:methylmalonyl-CoA mutase